MAGYLDKPTRWAANISTTAKKKGAALVRRPLTSINRTVATYDLADKANTLLQAIGSYGLQLPKKTPNSPPPLFPGKKYRRIRRRDGTIVLQAYRTRKPGSESEDTDTYPESASTSYSSSDSDARDASSSIPDIDDYFDGEDWVDVVDRHRTPHTRGRDDGTSRTIGTRDRGGESSRPSQPRAAPRRDWGWSRSLRELSKLLDGLEEEDNDADGEDEDDDHDELRPRGAAEGSVMFVPEVSGEREGDSMYYTAHSFQEQQ